MLGALALPAGPASAALPTVSAGACTSPTDVTVVVDYGPLGGGVAVRCVGNGSTPYSGTGWDVLNAAGFAPYLAHGNGVGMVCRIGGLPSAATPLRITGNPNYVERCIGAPPAAAYWSYWHATNGGKWTYSSTGVDAPVGPGGFEGWRFQLNATASTNQQPGFTPIRPAAPPAGSTPAPANPTAPAGGPNRPGGGANPPASGVGSPVQAGTPGAPGTGSNSSTSNPADPTSDPGATTSTTPGDPSGGVGAATSGAAGALGSSEMVAAGRTGGDSGNNPAATIAVLALLAVGGAATTVAVRRRRAR